MIIKHPGNFQTIASSRCAMDALKYSKSFRGIQAPVFLEKTREPIPVEGHLQLTSNLQRTDICQGSVLYICKSPHTWFISDASSDKEISELIKGIRNSDVLDQQSMSLLYQKGLLRINGLALPEEKLSGRYAVRSDNVALVSITDRCNLHCNHCVANANENKLVGQELSLEELRNIFQGIAKEGNPYGLNVEKKVFISGGEPAVRNDLETIAIACSNEGLSTHICTNSLLVSNELLRNLRGRDIAFSVSIDGERGNHEMVRGQGTFEKTLERIRAMRSEGFDVFFNTFLHKGNLDDIDYLVNLGAQVGVKGINFIRAIPRGRGKGMEFQRVPDEILFRKLYNFMKKDKEFYKILENENTFPILALSALSGVKSLNCGLSRENYLFLDSAGNVYPCPGTRYEEFKVGNVRTSDQNELLKRRKAHPLSDLNVETFPSCSPCDFMYFCGGDCRGSAYGNSEYKDIKSLVPYCSERKESLKEMFRILAEDPQFLTTKSKGIIQNAREETRRKSNG